MFKSPISVLQELAQSKRVELGEYTVVDTSGQDHCKQFTYQIIVNNQAYQGSGSTKQTAKTNCAQNALDAIKGTKSVSDVQVEAISFLPPVIRSGTNSILNQINYVGQLNEFQQTKKYPLAVYQDELPQGFAFCIKCTFAGFESRGSGSTKKEAKQNAARKMLELINEQKLGVCKTHLAATLTGTIPSFDIIPDEYIIQRYKELSLSFKDKANDRGQNIERDGEKIDENVEIITWNDLQSELDNVGYTYTDPETLQRNPWVLFMTINNGTMMGSGDTRQDALDDLIRNTTKMLKDGFTFSNKFSPEKSS